MSADTCVEHPDEPWVGCTVCAADAAPPAGHKGTFCRDCGSTNIGRTLGNCAGCGLILDGELNPVSRSEGMFHRRCWYRRDAR